MTSSDSRYFGVIPVFPGLRHLGQTVGVVLRFQVFLPRFLLLSNVLSSSLAFPNSRAASVTRRSCMAISPMMT